MSNNSNTPSLHGPDFDADPAEAYRWLQQHSPVHRVQLAVGLSAWLVTRYADVQAALADPRLVKDPARGCPAWRSSGMGLPLDHRPSLATHMTNTDPPHHRRLRRLAAGRFGPRSLAVLTTRVHLLIDDLLDRIAPLGRADLINDLASPLSTSIIGELIGIPVEDRADVRRWAAVIDASDATDREDLLSATDSIDRYLADLVRRKRDQPGCDLISDMLHRQQVPVSDDEMTSTAFLMLIAGHETSTAMIGNSVLALLTHPELAEQLRADLGRVPAFVEESLRRDCPVRNVSWRFPTEPMTLGGQLLQPGEPVLLSVLAANRDPEMFDNPDVFLPNRDNRASMAFGRGRHSCLGAALARIEGGAAIAALVRRFPRLVLAKPAAELRWWPSPIVRGLYELPVVF